METNNQAPEVNPKSNKTAKIAGMVVALLLILGLGWFFMSKKGTDSTLKGEQDGGMMANHEGMEQMSMKDLLATGKNQKCEVSYENGKTTNKGTMFFGNGKMRGDFNATTNGQVVASHMINDGKDMYMWVDGQSVAMKMSLEGMNNQPTSNQPNDQAQVIDQNAKYNYHCSNWSPDESLLTPPANINFMDQNIMMQGMPSAGAGASGSMGTSSQCAVCDQAGENKAACLAALKCN